MIAEAAHTGPARGSCRRLFGRRAQIAVLLVATTLAYLNSFDGAWHFDDEHAILESRRGRSRVRALCGGQARFR